MELKPSYLVALLASLFLAACDDSEDKVYVDQYPEVSLRIEIPFEAVAGETAIDCDTTLTGLGTADSSGQIADFRFFVHNVRLVLENGDELPVELDETDMQTDNIAMLDFRNKLDECSGDENPNMNKKLVGSITLGEGVTGTVTGLAFTLGVPASHNHADQALANGPLKNPGIASGMAWSWQMGYKFTGLDMLVDGGITTSGSGMGMSMSGSSSKWSIHLGSTGCTGDPTIGETVSCTYPNRSEISLDGFVIGNSKVQLDYAELVSANDLSADAGGATGCMSGATDPECESLFTKFGLVHALSGADPEHPPTQTVFSLVNL